MSNNISMDLQNVVSIVCTKLLRYNYTIKSLV